MKVEFLCRTHLWSCSCLYVKPRSFKILSGWIQEKNSWYGSMWGHDGLMSWAMVDQDIEHTSKWRILYVPQDIMMEHEKIQGWSRWSTMLGFYIGQHRKHKEGITWDESSCGMVSLSIMLCELTHYICVFVLSIWVRYLAMGMHQYWRFDIAHEWMTSSGDCHQAKKCKFKMSNLGKIICLKLAVHLVIMDMWRCASTELSHISLWGSKLWVFTKQQWSSEAFRLDGSMKRHHQDQAGCARQRYVLARFSFYRSQGGCWETGL
jgi:hypothetical protein